MIKNTATYGPLGEFLLAVAKSEQLNQFLYQKYDRLDCSAIASAGGFTRQAVHQWLIGKSYPTSSNARKLAGLFSIDFEAFSKLVLRAGGWDV